MRHNRWIPSALILSLATGLLLGSWWSSLAGPAIAQENATPDQGYLTSDEQRTIEVFERSREAVVFINTLGRRRDIFSRRVFEVREGSGSGFFWDNQGHIVTNYHVLHNATGAEIILDDQTRVRAQLVGVSRSHDLAVLKIDDPDINREALPHGDSARIRVGQTVLAIGNPFGLDHTLTRGVVSALNREIKALNGRTIGGVIQTDAAVNPGSSGGPLLDSSGRVIGVNTAILSPAGTSAGIAFAVPMATVQRVVPQLIESGNYTPPRMGVRFHDPTSQATLSRLGLQGALIIEVEPGSPAEKAGLRGTTRKFLGGINLGDVILAVDGQSVRDSNDLLQILETKAPGDTIHLTIWRNETRIAVEVTLK
ncbi:S1C family serine protease [Mucisphaera calidilacus]|uniref:Putative periplasmic serine endoprotease DegP-like n=1 Tax=Mucisphaera calidilacus TaxID=2527982 RepID=A0A518BZW9_9BACT|nr:trypsin-like peptidase domain-containing protein [Mucisphaera calidilacus]QDU72518.1 putative periplasmic serine endoprotease DegP-like precursor [Mucisphaera calidilacus]